MDRLKKSAVGKLAASILLILSVFIGTMASLHLLPFLSATDADSWQDTHYFQSLIYGRQSELVSYVAGRHTLNASKELSYMEQLQLQSSLQAISDRMDNAATWFRFQILSSDGQEVLYSNLPEGESLSQLVDTVFYATLPSQGDSAAASNVTDGRPPLILEYGAPLLTTDGSIHDEFSALAFEYNYIQTSFSSISIFIVCLAGLAGSCLCYLLWAAGHKTGVQGIVTTWQERIYFDLYLVLMLAAEVVPIAGIAYSYQYILDYYYHRIEPADHILIAVMAAASAFAALFAGIGTLTLRTFVVRCKAHILLKHTLLFQIAHFLWQSIRNFIHNLPLIWRMICAFFLFLFLLLFSWESRYDLGWLTLPLVIGVVLCALSWWTVCLRRLRLGSQSIAAGNLNHRIDTLHMPHDLKGIAEDLNNISLGLSSAVDEKMKSERFKAELITNVSHDLKTPLTSIINYVNLLKSTPQTDPTALGYIEVLDRKSQRLKKLTEDLVEASKASTGVLSVNREKISMAQLMDQALAEWREKLESQNLTVVSTMPEGDVWVYADGRHLWRVIDNLLSNCAKYTMEGTRIYMDLIRGRGQVIFSVKNISRDPLNIPPDRLMERFVRGDTARTTEGSGLGLSIARSLTELQGGEFTLTVDGDLFKATLILPQTN